MRHRVNELIAKKQRLENELQQLKHLSREPLQQLSVLSVLRHGSLNADDKI